jgi:hypothetical protein
MPTVKLTKFSQELRASWNMFLKTWRTSFKLVFLPVIPMLFTVPYLIELTSSLKYSQFPSLAGATIITFIMALVGVIAFIMLLEIVRASLFIIYDNSETGARKALQLATRRFPMFLYTDFLSFVYLFVVTAPLLILIFWANNGGREMLYSVFSPIIGDIVLLIIFIIFAIPLFILAIWLSFAQIIVATGKGSGFHALTYSTTLIRPILKNIVKRLIVWFIIYVVISYMVSPLPIASWFVPMILRLVGVAFLVVLYKEASGIAVDENVSVPARPRRIVRRSKEA